ncbi:Flavoredoxin [bioreactor metagenome]|uniref:Flavoredoxin n=1 Tax=bioreactor metagenome TaxID=1076179 RepID=A0A645II88_9ZZZZ
MECNVIDIFQISEHTQIIGEILDIKVDDSCINNSGLPDIDKIKPLLFDPAASQYHVAGTAAGQAFSVGKVFLTKDK